MREVDSADVLWNHQQAAMRPRMRQYEAGLQERAALAHHEAGHAVTAVLLAEPWRAELVVLGARIESAGFDGDGSKRDGYASKRASSFTAEENAVTAAAGPISELSYLRSLSHERVKAAPLGRADDLAGSSSDWQRFGELAQFIAFDVPVGERDQRLHGIKTRLRIAAEEAVLEARHAIKAVADALLQSGWLSGVQVVNIVRRAEPTLRLTAPTITAELRAEASDAAHAADLADVEREMVALGLRPRADRGANPDAPESTEARREMDDRRRRLAELGAPGGSAADDLPATGTRRRRRIPPRASAANTVELTLYGPIGEDFLFGGGISAKDFRAQIKALGRRQTLNLRINSPGGSVTDAAAMLAALDEHNGRIEVDVDGLAASAASVVMMGGDVIRVASNGLVMIHNPQVATAGSGRDMRRAADLLDKVREQLLDAYMRRCTASREQVSDWLDEEKWFTGAEAVAAGLADSVSGPVKMAATADLSRFGYRHAPPAAARRVQAIMGSDDS